MSSADVCLRSIGAVSEISCMSGCHFRPMLFRSGDCESTWEAMAETIRGGLSLTLSGFGFGMSCPGDDSSCYPVDADISVPI